MKQDAPVAPAAEVTMPSRGYLICCIERTGSTLLGGTLSRTGVAGHPIEYFNPVMQKKPRLLKILGDSNIVNGIDKVLAAGTTPNRVFGAKVHWGAFRFLGMVLQKKWGEKERLSMYDLLKAHPNKLFSQAEANDLLDSHYPDMSPLDSAYKFLGSHLPDLRFIWLVRQNMVARAVSLFRARQSGVWWRGVANPGEPQEEPTPEFDLAEIHTLNCLGIFQENCWRRFFEEHGLNPLYLTYEELAADYEPTVRRALDFLDVDADGIVIPPPASKKQSDTLSEEWEQRYREALPEFAA